MKVIKLENVSCKIGSKVLLEDISVDFSEGSCWAITGPNGSGKSLLAMIMGGALKESSGKVVLEGNTGYASFELQQKIMADERRVDNSRFMQGGIDPGTKVKDFILKNRGSDETLFLEYISMFNLEKILARGLRYLSTGEFRKIMLCRALMAKPDILIVDDPFDGLDVSAQKNLQQLFKTLVESDERIFLVTPRKSEIPEWADHVLELDEGRVKYAGKYAAKYQGKIPGRTAFEGWGREASDRLLPHENPSAFAHLAGSDLSDDAVTAAGKNRPPVISMKNVFLSYENEKILSDINWEVQKGEKWKITGPNGCGKSTLISLVNADNPKAYMNDITLFGIKKGSGETIWDIKKKIGFVSGDFQMNYRVRSTLLDTVLSGFFDSIGLYSEVSGLQLEEALSWIDVSGMMDKKNVPFKELSFGEKRKALIMRALVKMPELIILDEPCQGLDEENTSSVIDIIEKLASLAESTILLVSHSININPKGFNNHLTFKTHPEGGYTAVTSPSREWRG
ncbi:MAG: ATP-binding cassette domain-containing protein [Spirochaetia bacterium]|nr:ATP-binding cassette domain-containing protein [Spirochaetia bacterium]